MKDYQELLHSPMIPSRIVPVVQKAAQTNVPVLIRGEQGTEKELIAKIIHHTGDWRYYRFYNLDCKTLTEEAFDDELSRLLKEADHGTAPGSVYLKEIGHLNRDNQMRLLQLIEDGFFQNGVEKRSIKNLRFLSSSSENLGERIAQGKFSEDLYYRLNTLSIQVPPLRERLTDIPTIVQHILADHSRNMKMKKAVISSDALALLQSYWWPGNLRELERVIIRSAIFSEGGTLTEKDLLFETENEKNSFTAFLKKDEMKPPAPDEKDLLKEPNTLNTDPLPLFLIELIHRIKNPLVSVKTFTQLLREKFDDLEFRDYFYRIVTEDIEKIDTVLNGLLNYVKINTPMVKTNTVNTALEEALKKYEAPLENRKIKVFKKYEKDLPETIIHDEQLKYILSSLLQYAIPSITPNGTMGLLTKSYPEQAETGDNKIASRKEGGYVEVMIVFTGYKRPAEQFESVLGIQSPQQDGVIELELRLIREILQKNKGMMKFEVNEKKPRTIISLKFPIERRKVIYYQFANP